MKSKDPKGQSESIHSFPEQLLPTWLTMLSTVLSSGDRAVNDSSEKSRLAQSFHVNEGK